MSAAPLPPVLAQIADVVGEEAALKIATLRGGTQVYIPPVVAPDHWLAQAIGHGPANDLADALTAGLGIGQRVNLPLGPAGHRAQMQEQLDAMIAKGYSEREIALTTRFSASTIRRRRARLGKQGDERQMSLF